MISQRELERRVIDRAAKAVQERIPRRSLLVRATLAGCALAVAPIRYLTTPAWGVGCKQPNDCSNSSKCGEGYTVFCCSFNNENRCPPNTHIGGFWKCTSYNGNGLCSPDNVRWYLDCNADQDGPCNCSGGSSCCCHCFLMECSRYRTCCNRFRYGQCNDEFGTTYIKCRIVRCSNPCNLYDGCTDCSFVTDNATCAHDPACLN